MNKPTIGCTVIYQGRDGQVPAIITKVNDDNTVSLTVFNPEIAQNGIMQKGFISFETQVPEAQEPTYAFWTWPVITRG